MIISKIKEWRDEPDEWDENYYQKDNPINIQAGKYKFLEDKIKIKELKKEKMKINTFIEKAEQIFPLIITLGEQYSKLEARDILLHKLIYGQIEV